MDAGSNHCISYSFVQYRNKGRLFEHVCCVRMCICMCCLVCELKYWKIVKTWKQCEKRDNSTKRSLFRGTKALVKTANPVSTLKIPTSVQIRKKSPNVTLSYSVVFCSNRPRHERIFGGVLHGSVMSREKRPPQWCSELFASVHWHQRTNPYRDTRCQMRDNKVRRGTPSTTRNARNALMSLIAMLTLQPCMGLVSQF